MKKIKNRLFFLYALLALSVACSREDPQAQIPFVTVDIEINLQDVRYQSLHTEGWLYLNGGVRGIVLVKENNQYRAFERNCTYQPRDTCATVDMHSSGFYLIDDCCNSQFDKAGNVLQGPAQQSLLPYRTTQNGNYLSIDN